MWFPSEELQSAIIFKDDVLREPTLYPAELVEKLKEIDGKESPDALSDKFMYSVDGYIVTVAGWVGIHPRSSAAVKKEWMEHWQAKKNNPLTDF